MVMKQRYVWAGVASLALMGTASADGIDGPAAPYNVFVFGSGNFTSQYTDTEGDLAAGGSIAFQGSYTVAAPIQGNGSTSMTSPDPARIVVGGAMSTLNGGSVGTNGSGTIYYGSIAPVLNNAGTFSAAATAPNQTLVDFSASETLYTNYSQQLGALSATTVSPTGGTLTLTAHSGLNVFDINNGASPITLTGVSITGPSNATVLINVLGSGTFDFTNGSAQYSGGLSGAYVLYNFLSATTVELSGNDSGFDPQASILAPDAGVEGGYGAMSGQLIAGSYSGLSGSTSPGHTQFNDVLFAGSLPAPVPLPQDDLLLASGLLALAALGRRRTRAAVLSR